MEITTNYIAERFQTFNRQMFGGKLTLPRIAVSRAHTLAGALSFKRRRVGGKIVKTDFTLRISAEVPMTEREVEDTIIHEMIHYSIASSQCTDTSAHGVLFRRLMNAINERHGRHITISHRPAVPAASATATVAHRLSRPVLVATLELRDGRMAFKVLSRNVVSIASYCRQAASAPAVKRVRLYVSENGFFGGFPRSTALKMYPIDAGKLALLLNGHSREVDIASLAGRLAVHKA